MQLYLKNILVITKNNLNDACSIQYNSIQYNLKCYLKRNILVVLI